VSLVSPHDLLNCFVLSNDGLAELVREMLCRPSRLVGSSDTSLGILLLLPGASGSATEQVAAWRLNLFKIKIVVDGFLAPYTKRGPRHRGKPL
jgi:hypothetical protein